MTTVLWAMVVAVGLLLAALFMIYRRSNPIAVPVIVLPLVFAPLALACLYASQIVIQGFRGLASGEAGSVASALGAISRANEAILSAQIGIAFLLAVLFVCVLFGLRHGATSKPVVGKAMGRLALAVVAGVLLGALTVSYTAAPAISIPLAVIASDGTSVTDPNLALSREALEPLIVRNSSTGEISATVARYLLATATGSFLLLPFSLLAFIVNLLVSSKGVFTRSVAVAGLITFVLAGLVTGLRIQYHRALAEEIALVASAAR